MQLVDCLEESLGEQNEVGPLIGCSLNGNTFSSCMEDELKRERDDFAL
jgi:hypothetical protein